MAPAVLSRRQNYSSCDGFGNCYNYNDPWYNYGRWIVLVAIILGAFFLFLIFSCITARRRRRRGMQPFRGTGWAAGQTPYGHGPAQYAGGPQPYYAGGQQPPPPVYSAPVENQGYGSAQNQYAGANQGYFGGQQSGVELQQPNNTYQPSRGGEDVYAAPDGPPPTKKGGDGIIR